LAVSFRLAEGKFGAGALPCRLYGDWVGGDGRYAAIAPLLAGQRATITDRKAAGSRAEATVKKMGTGGLFSWGFLCQRNSYAAVAVLDPPAKSTPIL
jgi:hypothetical protein